jgi:hypothetical protein
VISDVMNQPAPAWLSNPGEPLWFLNKLHEMFSCELRYHGPWGVEAQILKDGALLIGRRFETRAEAVEWAESKWFEWKTRVS